MSEKEIIESNQESPKEISKTYTLFYSFFLIPLMIAFLAAFFFGIFNLLTYEKTTVFDLLDDIEYGSQTKKWQAAYILQTKIPEIKALPVPEYGTFKNRLVKIYKKNKSDLEYCQPETRLYLARLMGGIEDPFYIEYLLDLEQVQRNLIYLTAAYNGGPGNLSKWQKKTNHLDDPLLFMESIPSRETRWFIEKVLTKYWIYNNKFGNQSDSLSLLAKGKNPIY